MTPKPAIALLLLAAAAPAAVAQAVRGQSGPMQEAARLDLAGRTAQARTIYTALLDSASDPRGRATVQRAMAISYAFDGDCGNATKYEDMVVSYWATREAAEPQNAFFQEGEVADEAARICLDAGDLGAAERWYRRGYELGTNEPAPPTHPRSLWDYRLAHALGRLAARRGDTAEVRRQIAAAQRILDGDSAMAAGQRRFFPYLVGYAALYTGDLTTAEARLQEAALMRGNERDPFMRCLLGMAYERAGRKAEADSAYHAAYDLATAHNPPAAFVRPFTRRKLGLPASP